MGTGLSVTREVESKHEQGLHARQFSHCLGGSIQVTVHEIAQPVR